MESGLVDSTDNFLATVPKVPIFETAFDLFAINGYHELRVLVFYYFNSSVFSARLIGIFISLDASCD
jgi:hypothetical protein